MVVLDAARARLAAECTRAGKGESYRLLAEYVLEQPEHDEYQRLAERTGLKANTIAQSVARLRQRLRQHLRDELAETVDSRTELDSELSDLRDALKGALD
jgi:RNA polymerase sigma-70 factor (ECF subfamily)